MPGADGRSASTLAYNGVALDRAAALRGDSAWVASIRSRASSRLIPFWNDKCLLRGGSSAGPEPVALNAAEAGPVLEAAACTVFLGLDGLAGVFADLSELAEPEATGLTGASAVLEAAGPEER